MLSAGIVRSDNALVVSFVKLFLFPNLLSCILFAWTCFFIATISTGPSSWGDPLPIGLTSPETNGSSLLADTGDSPPEQTTSEKSSQTPIPEVAADNLYLYAHANWESGEESQQLGSLPFRSPAVVALPDALDIARALRPFRHQIPLLAKFVLDEDATAERSAQEGRWVPVLDHAR